MAEYSWKCPECEQVTEVVRPMKDYLVPPGHCFHCGVEGEEVKWKKVLSSHALHRGFTFGRKGAMPDRPITCKKWERDK